MSKALFKLLHLRDVRYSLCGDKLLDTRADRGNTIHQYCFIGYRHFYLQSRADYDGRVQNIIIDKSFRLTIKQKEIVTINAGIHIISFAMGHNSFLQQRPQGSKIMHVHPSILWSKSNKICLLLNNDQIWWQTPKNGKTVPVEHYTNLSAKWFTSVSAMLLWLSSLQSMRYKPSQTGCSNITGSKLLHSGSKNQQLLQLLIQQPIVTCRSIALQTLAPLNTTVSSKQDPENTTHRRRETHHSLILQAL